MAKTIDLTLNARLRESVDRGRLTESELRELTADADGSVRSLRGQIRGSERRLRRLTGDPTSGVAEIADELRRLETLKAQLAKTEALLDELEQTGRALRTAWLLGQAEAARRP